ncbi:MAG: hypothetical protein AB7G93_02715 [Bdellovibrionales bacterium]
MNLKTTCQILLLGLALVFCACGKILRKPKAHSISYSDPPPRSQLAKHTEGGQPGGVYISGAPVRIVNSKPYLDDRITVELKGGMGISGTEAPVLPSSHPELLEKLREKTLFKVPADQSIIGVGCDSQTMNRFSEGLKTKQPVQNKETLTVHLDASVVVLCGKIDFGFQFVALNADLLVLTDLDYSQRGILNVTRFSTNRLLLIGLNKVTSTAAEMEDTEFPGPILNLEVAKELQSEQDGKLKILSIGTSYRKAPKPAASNPPGGS